MMNEKFGIYHIIILLIALGHTFIISSSYSLKYYEPLLLDIMIIVFTAIYAQAVNMKNEKEWYK